MITINNISKSYAGKSVLSNVSLEIGDGEFVVITGKSGCGKTTLLNIMGLLETPDSGTVTFDGKIRFSRKDTAMFYRHSSGFLFQNFALIDNESVWNNLKIAVAYLRLSQKEKTKKIHAALVQVGLPKYESKKIYQLSGGEQQRVALARVILKEPRYIFADEPTGNLDAENRDLVFEHLKELRNQGRTVIVVTHDTKLAQADCVDRLIEL